MSSTQPETFSVNSIKEPDPAGSGTRTAYQVIGDQGTVHSTHTSYASAVIYKDILNGK